MGPQIETNVESMLLAMEKTIIPALPAEASLAREQAFLMIGYLRTIAEQHDKIMHYRVKEIREYRALISDLLAQLPSTSSNKTAAAQEALRHSERYAEQALPDYDTLCCVAKTLRTAAGELTDLIWDLNAQGRMDVSVSVSTIILRQAQSEALRDRAWWKALGIAPDAAFAPLIDDVLAD